MNASVPTLISPADFYSTEAEKTKLNWFLFEYAAEFEVRIKKPLRAKLKRKKITDEQIAALCIHYAKHMKQEILDRLSRKTDVISHSYEPIEAFLPSLPDKLVDNLLSVASDAWETITDRCSICPTRCISEKDKRAPMFDDPFYYE